MTRHDFILQAIKEEIFIIDFSLQQNISPPGTKETKGFLISEIGKLIKNKEMTTELSKQFEILKAHWLSLDNQIVND